MISTIITPAIIVSNILINKREKNIKNKLKKKPKVFAQVYVFQHFFNVNIN